MNLGAWYCQKANAMARILKLWFHGFLWIDMVFMDFYGFFGWYIWGWKDSIFIFDRKGKNDHGWRTLELILRVHYHTYLHYLPFGNASGHSSGPHGSTWWSSPTQPRDVGSISGPQAQSRVRLFTASAPHVAPHGLQSHQPAHWHGTCLVVSRPNGPIDGLIFQPIKNPDSRPKPNPTNHTNS